MTKNAREEDRRNPSYRLSLGVEVALLDLSAFNVSDLQLDWLDVCRAK